MARKATPEEKKVYDTIVMQALRFLHGKEPAMQLKQMASQGNPAEAVATVTATTLKQIMAAAQQSGKQITPKYYIPAGVEIMQHLVEMLMQFGVIQQQQAAQVLEQAKQVFQQIVGGQ